MQTLWPDHCVQNTVGSEFHSGFNIAAINFIQKKGMNSDIDSYSAFRDNGKSEKTGLDDYIKKLNVNEVHICGLALDYCVFYSAMDAKEMLDSKIKIIVIDDLCRGINENGVENAKQNMKKSGIQILNSENIIGSNY